MPHHRYLPRHRAKTAAAPDLRWTRLALGGMLALLIFALLTVTARAEVFKPETAKLDNGLEIVVLPNTRIPVVTHMVWYRVGGADDPAGKSGIAHFLEHLMFKGTEKMAPGEFSETVKRNGGNDNAFTGYDYTAYYQEVPKDKLALVMEMEADRMANLRLDPKEVLPERDVVLEERRSRTDNSPQAKFREMVSAATYLAYPYRVPLIGWEHEIRGLDEHDAVAFYERHYGPNNAILVVAGDTTLEEVVGLAKQYYGPIPAREIAPRQRPFEPEQLAARRLEMESDQVAEPSWSRTYQAPGYVWGETKHAYPLQILSEILSGGASSRIYKALVIEQGIAANAGAWYSPDQMGPSSFGFYGSPRPGKTVEEVEKAILDQIALVLKEGITDEELASAKVRMEAAAIYARDGRSGPARVFGEALTIGMTIEDVEAWPARMAAVTAEQVMEAARAVFVEARSVTAILRPAKKDS